MIVILTGATGLIGGEILRQCLACSGVTQIYAITRRPLDNTYKSEQSEKLKNVIHKDFHSYPDELLDQLTGADTCIWSLGDPFAKNVREIDVEFTMKAANAFIEKLQPKLSQPRKFKFVFVSGQFAAADPNKSLWMLRDARLAKGEAETSLFQLEKDRSSQFDVSVVRPGVVAKADGWMPNLVVDLLQGVRADHLACAILDIIQKGYKSKTVYSRELSRMGKAALGRHESNLKTVSP